MDLHGRIIDFYSGILGWSEKKCKNSIFFFGASCIYISRVHRLLCAFVNVTKYLKKEHFKNRIFLCESSIYDSMCW